MKAGGALATGTNRYGPYGGLNSPPVLRTKHGVEYQSDILDARFEWEANGPGFPSQCHTLQRPPHSDISYDVRRHSQAASSSSHSSDSSSHDDLSSQNDVSSSSSHVSSHHDASQQAPSSQNDLDSSRASSSSYSADSHSDSAEDSNFETFVHGVPSLPPTVMSALFWQFGFENFPRKANWPFVNSMSSFVNNIRYFILWLWRHLSPYHWWQGFTSVISLVNIANPWSLRREIPRREIPSNSNSNLAFGVPPRVSSLSENFETQQSSVSVRRDQNREVLTSPVGPKFEEAIPFHCTASESDSQCNPCSHSGVAKSRPLSSFLFGSESNNSEICRDSDSNQNGNIENANTETISMGIRNLPHDIQEKILNIAHEEALFDSAFKLLEGAYRVHSNQKDSYGRNYQNKFNEVSFPLISAATFSSVTGVSPFSTSRLGHIVPMKKRLEEIGDIFVQAAMKEVKAKCARIDEMDSLDARLNEKLTNDGHNGRGIQDPDRTDSIINKYTLVGNSHSLTVAFMLAQRKLMRLYGDTLELMRNSDSHLNTSPLRSLFMESLEILRNSKNSLKAAVDFIQNNGSQSNGSTGVREVTQQTYRDGERFRKTKYVTIIDPILGDSESKMSKSSSSSSSKNANLKEKGNPAHSAPLCQFSLAQIRACEEVYPDPTDGDEIRIHQLRYSDMDEMLSDYAEIDRGDNLGGLESEQTTVSGNGGSSLNNGNHNLNHNVKNGSNPKFVPHTPLRTEEIKAINPKSPTHIAEIEYLVWSVNMKPGSSGTGSSVTTRSHSDFSNLNQNHERPTTTWAWVILRKIMPTYKLTPQRSRLLFEGLVATPLLPPGTSGSGPKEFTQQKPRISLHWASGDEADFSVKSFTHPSLETWQNYHAIHSSDFDTIFLTQHQDGSVRLV